MGDIGGKKRKRALFIPRTLLVVKIKKLSATAKTPIWAGEVGVGFSVYCIENYLVKSGGRQICYT